MYTQLFNLLCTIADDEYHGKLPVHVRCILDEFAKALEDIALVDKPAKMEGRSMAMFLTEKRS